MAKKSELEQYLASTSSEGQVDSPGVFTVGGQEALRKIAEYQLPFSGAWAVKVIQSIVASQTESSIRVDLAVTEIRFFFAGAGFTLDEFSAAFYTPEPSPNRALNHLLSGLWPVALKDRWGFQIAFARQAETLIWDGARLNRVQSFKTRDRSCISIAPLQQKATLSWIARLTNSGRRNSELLIALSQACYTCPLPLTVDGRRIDSLKQAEFQGWGRGRYPLSIDFAPATLPELRLPPGTFEGVNRGVGGNLFNDDGGGWSWVAGKQLKKVTARKSAPLAFLLCVNMKSVGDDESTTWESGSGPSTAYWVSDGAVIGTDPLVSGTSHCSVGCFLNAEGLKSDFSTLQVLKSTERSQRLALARKSLAAALQSLDSGYFEDLLKRKHRAQTMMGGALVSGGLVYLWVMPSAGVIAIVSGVVVALQGGKTESESQRVKSARASIKKLSGLLRNSRPPSER